MARYFLKPVFWNTNGYQSPSGAHATSGYPKENGYGHEEWNNSDRLTFDDRGQRQHAFHSEPITGLTEDDDGQVFVFLYASHDGVQELVSAAGRATWLGDMSNERARLADILEIDELIEETWEVEQVRRVHNNNKRAFLRGWRQDRTWIPNWTCPRDLFFMPSSPVLLDANNLTGSSKLLTMYGGFTPISAAQAMRVLASVPQEQRTPEWGALRNAIGLRDSEVESDVRELRNDPALSATTRKQLVDARLGQGRFRSELEVRWDRSCAVTGCTISAVLRASHIKPWKEATNKERLDPANGLLLAATIDALFDRGLISFDSNGAMVVSKRIPGPQRALIGVPMPLRRPPDEAERHYLAIHRKSWKL